MILLLRMLPFDITYTLNINSPVTVSVFTSKVIANDLTTNDYHWYRLVNEKAGMFCMMFWHETKIIESSCQVSLRTSSIYDI